MARNIVAALILIITLFQQGRASSPIDSTLRIRPVLAAVRATGEINIDGKLTEPEWQRAGIDSFTQRDPVEGAAPTEKTEVWVAYDDAAIYIAARLFDSPDSIITQVGRRDVSLDSDWFIVGIDSYHDRRTGYKFAVNPASSIYDAVLYNDEWEDNTWDGVWSSAANIDSKGWTVEMRIPYSQLRFPTLQTYTWGINFQRNIQRKNEQDFFVMVPKKENGTVSRFADLTGIANINPPRKLEILPYVSSSGKYLNHDIGDPFNTGSAYVQNLGADIKLGLGSNLTLNGTINPDFGQVEVDPAVVNLTQYETYFNEKRPFFVEGSNMFDFGFSGANNNWGFNWGSPSFFYSRRIGRPPAGDLQHDGFSDVPDRTHIIGAAKITGKVADQWTLGALQAVTSREYAQVADSVRRFSDIVEPPAYYGIARVLGEFEEGKKGFGVIGTATARNLNQPYLYDEFNHHAYTLGTDGWINLDAKKSWVLVGWVAGSRIDGTTQRLIDVQRSPLHYYQRPDAKTVSVDSSATSLSGYAGRFAVNKETGGFLFNGALGFVSPGFESNDLGYVWRTNLINTHLVLGYAWYEPDGIFRRKSFNVATYRSFDFDGYRIGNGYFLFTNLTMMNYWWLSGSASYTPAYISNNQTRGGPLMEILHSRSYSLNIGTDSREPVIISASVNDSRNVSGSFDLEGGPQIDWKISSGARLSVGPYYMNNVAVAQYVDQVTDNTAIATYGARYLFARLDQRELSANIRFDYTFTPQLSLQLFLQPLISVGRYTEFKELARPGTWEFNQFYSADSTIAYSADDGTYTIYPTGPHGAAPAIIEDNPDFNYKSLRGNAVLRWEYLPGSALYFVWTNQKINDGAPGDYRFMKDFNDLITSHTDNVFQIKMTYWWNP